MIKSLLNWLRGRKKKLRTMKLTFTIRHQHLRAALVLRECPVCMAITEVAPAYDQGISFPAAGGFVLIWKKRVGFRCRSLPGSLQRFMLAWESDPLYCIDNQFKEPLTFTLTFRRF